MYEPRIQRKVYNQYLNRNIEALGWVRFAPISGWCCSIYLVMFMVGYV